MIRIISGEFKGRFLKVPESKNTRPTMDKVRQAMFSAIKDKALSSVALDLFAGSGAIGLEALSRGAKMVYFIEKDFKTFKTLKENVKSLDEDGARTKAYLTDYRLFLKKNNNLKFDLVFLDPPYRFTINDKIISYLLEKNMLNDDFLIVSEQDYKNNEIEGLTFKEYRYGEKFVAIYKRS